MEKIRRYWNTPSRSAYGDYLKEEANNKDDEYEEGEEE